MNIGCEWTHAAHSKGLEWREQRGFECVRRRQRQAAKLLLWERRRSWSRSLQMGLQWLCWLLRWLAICEPEMRDSTESGVLPTSC